MPGKRARRSCPDGSVRELGRRDWNEIGEGEVFDRGAGLSYYVPFALFPQGRE